MTSAPGPSASDPRDLYALGEMPPRGHVPRRMHASVVRQSRFGDPRAAFRTEVVDTPPIGPRQVLVWVMAAGVNYNNVWAALGRPVDVIAARNRRGEPEDFHIGGSDASGIVWAVGAEARGVRVGDEVVIHCGTWDEQAADIAAGADPITSSSAALWGYDVNYGAFAQFTRVEDYQCLPKPPRLTWEEAAAYLLVGATAYRQLMGWPPHTVRPGDPVLIWGGAGGLGSLAIQVTKAAGGIPIAVVSEDDRVAWCLRLGARGVINRSDPAFTHWGRLPDLDDAAATAAWMTGARAFAAKFWEALGERRAPRIVFEHPGEATIPTSMFLVDNAGMVVICAGTTGYNADVDLRYLWTRQKRLQGSHFANTEQCAALNELVASGVIDPALSRTFPFEAIGEAHGLMYENRHPPGNMAILVNAPREGLTTIE